MIHEKSMLLQGLEQPHGFEHPQGLEQPHPPEPHGLELLHGLVHIQGSLAIVMFVDGIVSRLQGDWVVAFVHVLEYPTLKVYPQAVVLTASRTAASNRHFLIL